MTTHAPIFRRFALWVAAALSVAMMPHAASAQRFIDTRGIATEQGQLSWTETVVEEWVTESGADDGAFDAAYGGADDNAWGFAAPKMAQSEGYAADSRAARFVDFRTPAMEYRPARALARSGPFAVTAADTIEMDGTVDSNTPRQFASLIARFPGVRKLVMRECPGSVDEDANHVLARAVRRAGLTTIVPAGGSVRSGAVDLFLAGVERIAAPDAEFGVHSWQDEDGNGPQDFAANDPVNTVYINYYREMGMTPDAARRFYAMTNSVPFESVRYLSARDMAGMGLARIAG
jgi:hypothetical protein